MVKRGQNEGSIYKRRDGRWVGVISLGYVNRKRKRKAFYGATRREVQERLTSALKTTQEGQPIPPERQSVSQFLEEWLQNSAKPTIRPRTYVRYGEHVRNHISPAIGHIKLAKLTPQHVQALLNEKLGEGLAPATVRYMHAVLRRALKQAFKWDLVSRNVAVLVDAPRVAQKEIEPFTPEQARVFLDAIRGDRLEALYSVALAVGLRKGEVLGLKWSDVHLDKRTLTVRASLQRINGALVLVEPKSKQSRRTVALPQIVIDTVRVHRVRQIQERLLAGSRWQDHGLVFPTTIGTPMDTRNLTRHFRRALQDAGLPLRRFHDLRHSCASLLLVQGVHPRVVMEILGHSQISLTMNTYSHVIDKLQHEAAAQIDAVLGT